MKGASLKTKHAVNRKPSRKKATSKKRVKTDINIVDIIDKAFASKLTVIENGKSQHRTVLQEIYRQLWKREMEGDLQAINVRLAYERFVLEQSPQEGREIIVTGGLPR